MIEVGEPVDNPCEALRAALLDETVQAVLGITRRQHPEDRQFEDEALAAVEDPSTATIYLMNILHMTKVYKLNRERFKARHGSAYDRTAKLVDCVLPSMLEVIEEPHSSDSLSEVFMQRLNPEELAKLAENDKSLYGDAKTEAVYQALGVPTDRRFPITGLSWLDTYRRVEDMIENGQIYVGTRHGIFDAHLLFGGDLTGTVHMNSNVIGIGEYEQPFAEKLVRAHALMAKAVRHARPAFMAYEEEVGPDEVRRFARSMDYQAKENSNEHLATQGTVYEGSLTLVQSLTTLGALKQPGYEDPDGLVEAIIEQGVMERFARTMPYSAIIGPVSIRGLVWLDALQVDNGTVSLTRELETAFAEARRITRDHELLGADVRGMGDNDYQHKFLSHSGCPAAYDQPDGTNAVAQMAGLFKRAYQRV